MTVAIDLCFLVSISLVNIIVRQTDEQLSSLICPTGCIY